MANELTGAPVGTYYLILYPERKTLALNPMFSA
jgi:hypothetical protein